MNINEVPNKLHNGERVEGVVGGGRGNIFLWGRGTKIDWI